MQKWEKKSLDLIDCNELNCKKRGRNKKFENIQKRRNFLSNDVLKAKLFFSFPSWEIRKKKLMDYCVVFIAEAFRFLSKTQSQINNGGREKG